MDLTQVTILHHMGIVLLLIWGLSSFNCCHSLVYVISFIYLFLVHERYVMRLKRQAQFEERRHSNQRNVLFSSESLRWLNYGIEKMWPICLEQIVSQKFMLPILPWFLQKYKPWILKEATSHSLYLGRSPPLFTEMRVLRQCPDDDHMVFELGMTFCAAEDMIGILDVKLRKVLAFGMCDKLHLEGMHVEGKVQVGLKFISKWPFLGRLRTCFVETPYYQMTVKPAIAHGIVVTELPGISIYGEKLFSFAFEDALVEPNMLVIDVEKCASTETADNWFFDAKDPVGYAVVEIIEASDIKPAVLNGLADPYVKGKLGVYKFRTKPKKKTLTPKWLAKFKIPICSWESPNVLNIEVRDKNHFIDNILGDCSIDLNNFQDGQRHDIWLNLQNIKKGRLHIAIRVLGRDGEVKVAEQDTETVDYEYKRNSFASDSDKEDCFSSEQHSELPCCSNAGNKFEAVDIEGQLETRVWVQHIAGQRPLQVVEKWVRRRRKGKNIIKVSQIHEEDVAGGSIGSSSEENLVLKDHKKTTSKNQLKTRGFRFQQKMRSCVFFHKSHQKHHEKGGNFDESVPSSPHPK